MEKVSRKPFMGRANTVRISKLTQAGIITGKLKAEIPAHTPSGIRYDTASIFLAMPCKDSPIRRAGVEQAYSRISEIRKGSAQLILC